MLGLGDSKDVVSLSVIEDRSTVEIEMRETAALWVGLNCPKATLVDKFQVIKLANEAVDKVRRRESRELPWCGKRRKKAATSG